MYSAGVLLHPGIRELCTPGISKNAAGTGAATRSRGVAARRETGEGRRGRGGGTARGGQARMNINVLKQLNARSKRALRRALSINPQPSICIDAAPRPRGSFVPRYPGRDCIGSVLEVGPAGEFVTVLRRSPVKWFVGVYRFVKGREPSSRRFRNVSL